MERKNIQMTFDEFIKKYKPIKNPSRKDNVLDGYMFESYGKDWEELSKYIDKNKIWTYFYDDDSDNEEIYHGFLENRLGIVNRIAYVISSVPYDPNDDITVLVGEI